MTARCPRCGGNVVQERSGEAYCLACGARYYCDLIRLAERQADEGWPYEDEATG